MSTRDAPSREAVAVPGEGRVTGPDGGQRAAPNTFIVGAPKSGTSALGRFLSTHPEIFVAGKELSYFGSDLDFRTRKGMPWHIGWDQYLAWFEGHGEARRRIDRSVFYLYSRSAAAEIHRHDPKSRIIVLLRNPVDQMHSEHAEMLYQGEEDITDFAEALEAEADRMRGRRIPPGCQRAFGLFYRDLARYAGQVDRYFEVFGRDQVHVLLHDDLVADPAGSYRDVLRFLDVDDGHRPEFSVVNASKRVRSRSVLRMLRTTSPRVRRFGRMLVRGPAARARLRQSLARLNTVERPRVPLSPSLRAALEEEFEPETARLEALLDVDLARWRSPGRGSAR